MVVTGVAPRCQEGWFLGPGLKLLESESRPVVPDSLLPHGLYSPWNSVGQNTGAGSHSLLQGDLPNPGVEPMSPALEADSLLF